VQLYALHECALLDETSRNAEEQWASANQPARQ